MPCIDGYGLCGEGRLMAAPLGVLCTGQHMPGRMRAWPHHYRSHGLRRIRRMADGHGNGPFPREPDAVPVYAADHTVSPCRRPLAAGLSRVRLSRC
jgi:hypothetical protein